MPDDIGQPQPVVSQDANFLSWWFVDQPKFYWELSVRMGRKVIQYFSITLLLKTLFAPWKRDLRSTSRMPLDLIVRTIIENGISRGVGFVIRTFTIVLGLITALVTFIACVAMMLFWILAPALVVLVVYWSVKI